MKRLSIIAILVTVLLGTIVVPALSANPMPEEHMEALRDASATYGVPEAMMLAVVETESGFDPWADNGYCVGYMQIAGPLIDWLSGAIGISDLRDPAQNLRAGAYILGDFINRYQDWTLALMCYNAGEGGAQDMWACGIWSTGYTQTVMERYAKWGGDVGSIHSTERVEDFQSDCYATDFYINLGKKEINLLTSNKPYGIILSTKEWRLTGRPWIALTM